MFPFSALDEVVEVSDVGLMMLSVVILEGFHRKISTKAVAVVGEFREREHERYDIIRLNLINSKLK